MRLRWIRQHPRRVAAVAACVGVCLVVAVAIALFVRPEKERRTYGDSTAIASLGETLSVDADPLVVTQVRVVTGDTDDAARDACSALNSSDSTAEWHVAGPNLNTTTTAAVSFATGAFSYLCIQQTRITAINRSTVLQSLHVLNTDECPLTLAQVFQPRPGVVVCSQNINASHAVATGMYVSDITATRERTYFDTTRGWITQSPSVGMANNADASLRDANPIYLRYRRPVRPIVSMRVLHNVVASDTTRACLTQLGLNWEQAGHGTIRTTTSDANRTVLCIKRAFLNATDPANVVTALPKILVDIGFVSTTSNCSIGFDERQPLSLNWTWCGAYADTSATTSFIGELRVQDISGSIVSSARSPSDFQVQLLDTNVDNSSTIVLYRRHAGIVVDGLLGGTIEANLTTLEAAPAVTPSSTTTLPVLVARREPSSSYRRQLRDEENTIQSLTFKIVQLADLHLTGDAAHACRNPPQDMIDSGKTCSEADTTAFVRNVLDVEKPDLVVFTGDNVDVPKGGSMSAAIEAMVGPVEARKIPYAVVFGNHDDENGHSRADLAERLIGRPYSYMQWGPTSVAGVGNYELNVVAPSDGPWGRAGSEVFQMYLLDSHGYPNATRYPGIKSSYDWIKPDQIAYYKEMAAANRNRHRNRSTRNGSVVVPAVMFFHIPIPEYASVGSASYRSGDKNEKVESSEIQSDLFSALVEMGDVKATFVGHDHINEYCYKRQGINLCYGGGSGFAQAYGSAQFARRTRVIEWRVDSGNRRRLTSWKRHYGSGFGSRQLEEVLFDEDVADAV